MESTLEMLNESLLQTIFLVQDHGMNGRRLRTPMDKYHLTPKPTIYKWMEMVISNHFLYKDLESSN